MVRRARRTLWVAVLIALPAASLPSCSRPKDPAPDPPGQAGGDEVVARVDGVNVTLTELDKRASGSLAVVRQQEYEARRRALDELVVDQLLARDAKARGISTEELLKAEIDDKVPTPTQAQVEATYRQYQRQLGGKTLAEARPDIERALREQNRSQRRQLFLDALRKKASVTIALRAPRWQVPLPATAPALGPAKAGVTIVEYIDYQCPYCRRAQSTVVEEILSRYGQKVRFVHRDFPIDGHPRAFAAAQAARCAGEQGKFWDYHRLLFASTPEFTPEELRKLASNLGLDGSAFGACLDSGRYDKDIRASAESGTLLGVNSTPTFFVNGRMVVGARPMDQFEELIEQELASGG